MKVWNAIFNLIAVVIIAIMINVIYSIDDTNQRQFEEVRLSYAIDYATEGAFRACIATDSIGTDYSNEGLKEVELNPTMVLPTFYNVLALSYDLSPSDANFMKIEQSIATGFLAAVNGYYVLEPAEVDTNPLDYEIGEEYRLLWGVKRPYLVYTREGSGEYDGRLFAVNLVNEKSTEYITEGVGIGGVVEEPFVTRDKYEGTNLNEDIVNMSISKLLTEDINYAIHARNAANIYGTISTFYVPSSDSMTAVNDVTSPALAIIFQDSTFLNGYDMDVISIGGARVKPKTQIIGFTLNGTKYYCFAGQQLGRTFITGEPKPQIGEGEKIFKSIHEAAKAGYSPHMMFLQEPFGKGY